MKSISLHNLFFIILGAVIVVTASLLSMKMFPQQFPKLPAFVAFQPEEKSVPVQQPPPVEESFEPEPVKEEIKTYQYIEILDGCGPSYNGVCVNVRSGPGTDYPVIAKLRTGVVLKVEKIVEGKDRDWYKIIFDEKVRYEERIESDWYVAKDFGVSFQDIGDEILTKNSPKTNKKIIVDRGEQMLYAYDGEELFMQRSISTGKELTPTPRGNFRVFKKTPSRYMQGPLPDVSDQYYDLPGVPWNLYFTNQGAVIHGAYWHDNFGQPWSHGCVNLGYEDAKKLYSWADIGTKVIVQD